MVRWLKALFLISFIIFGAKEAIAWCPDYHQTIQSQFKESTSIFIGKVMSEKTVERDGIENFIYRVEASRYFKGDSSKKVIEVVTENSSGRFPIEIGKTYVLFGQAVPKSEYIKNGSKTDNLLEITNCDSNSKIEEAGPVIEELKQILTSAQQTQPTYIGIYENLNDGWNKNRPAQVRVAFRSSDNGWVAMKHKPENEDELKSIFSVFPKAVSWIAIYDGKKLGEIYTSAIVTGNYSEVGIQNIVSLLLFKEIFLGASGFVYWVGSAKARPLLLSSGTHFDDPDSWKPTKVSEREKNLIVTEFRKLVPTVLDCKGSENVTKVYRDGEIKFEVPFRSKDGTVLIGLGLDSKKYYCDGPTGDECGERWFVLWKDGHLKYLGANLHPIDAADLNNDGKSEWLFQINRYDNDGYEIFWNNFSKSDTFDWIYH